MVPRTLRFSARPDPVDHDEAFLSRYARLLRVARAITEPGAAEDLVHDAYVQFVVAQPDLAAIDDLDAYLSTIIRNLHLSRVRRRLRQPALAVFEFDSADLALRATADHELLARDDLSRMVAFVCTTKHRSRPLSILALRYFHGLAPTDIARALFVRPKVVYEAMPRAVAELRTAFERRRALPHASHADTGDAAAFIASLRRALFAAPTPPCPDPAAQVRAYASGRPPLTTIEVSHLVSCRDCLTRVRILLALPPDDDLPPPPAGDGAANAGVVRQLRRRHRDVLAHRPSRLSVSINGIPVGVTQLGAGTGDVTWTVGVGEPAAFAEVHSEQGVLLGHLPLVAPPAGRVFQTMQVRLADDRALTLSVSWAEAQPTLRLQYGAGSLPADQAAAADTGQDDYADGIESGPAPTASQSFEPSWHRVLGSLWGRRFAAVTAFCAVAALLAVARQWSPMPVASPTAATVLADARFADPQPGPGLARERRLRLAARSASGATQEWQVVEWTADGGARSATRVLDGAGQTVGGAWHAPDEPPTVRLIGRFDDVWQAGLSVDAFERRTTGAACTTRADGEYLAVDCRVGVARSWLDVVVPTLAAQAVTRVEAASLWLRRADLRVARQQLLTRGAEGEWTITFDERARREIPIASAPSGVFVAPAPRPVSATVLTPVTPSAELQALDVTQAMPESSVLQVERRGDMLAVSGYVATAAERERLATSLRLVVPDGRLQLQVETYDEAAPRTRPGRARAELRSVGGVSPLTAYLSRPGTGVADPEATSTELAAVLLLEGARLRREAAAVAALLGRFPPGSAPSWTAAGRAAWHRMTGRALSVSTRALSRIDASLAPYCPSGPATSDAAADAGPREMNAAALAVRFLEAATRAYEAAAETVSADAQTDGRDPCARVRDAARQASAAAALLQTAIATTP